MTEQSSSNRSATRKYSYCMEQYCRICNNNNKAVSQQHTYIAEQQQNNNRYKINLFLYGSTNVVTFIQSFWSIGTTDQCNNWETTGSVVILDRNPDRLWKSKYDWYHSIPLIGRFDRSSRPDNPIDPNTATGGNLLLVTWKFTWVNLYD
jgi:hypothetical protein